MIYLDTSSLLKLVHTEPETAALEDWLSHQADARSVSSELAKVEVMRGCRRLDEALLPAARDMLTEVALIPLSGGVVDRAAEIAGSLRSLDAIHLASALLIQEDLTAFVCYDRRLTEAAETAGLVCVHPGPAA